MINPFDFLGDVSIRSPHRSKGRPILRGEKDTGTTVSIRSPHRSKGRRGIAVTSTRIYVFQSAPLTEARGDLCGYAGTGKTTLFQSAPLTEARGD